MIRLLPLFAALACAPAEDPVPAEPPVPLDRSDTRVTFPGADFDLEGVLTLPDRIEGEPVPAVVLVHGSGPNSRDAVLPGQLNMGFGFEIPVFADLADGLASEGYAVLRYDKRSCFAGNGCDNSYPTPDPDILVSDFLADAAAATDWLATHPEVDPDRRIAVGHSQGGHLVSHLLADDPSLHAGVMLSGGFRPIDALLEHQLVSSEELLRDLGYGDGTIEVALADLQGMVDDLAAVRSGSFGGAAIGGAPVAFWTDWMALDDSSPDRALAVDQPILSIGGDYDWNVPAAEAESWGAHLEPLDRGHRAAVLPCVTHALNCVSEPDWTRIGPDDIGQTVDPAVVSEITAFLGGVAD